MSVDRESLEKIGGRFLVICFACSLIVTLLGSIILFIYSISYGLLSIIYVPLLILSLIGNFLIYLGIYGQIKEDKLW